MSSETHMNSQFVAFNSSVMARNLLSFQSKNAGYNGGKNGGFTGSYTGNQYAGNHRTNQNDNINSHGKDN